MALGSTQPLTEMSTRNISWGYRRPVRRADNPTTFMCRLSWNLGASTSWNPQGLSRPVMGLLYLYRYLCLNTVSYIFELCNINFLLLCFCTCRQHDPASYRRQVWEYKMLQRGDLLYIIFFSFCTCILSLPDDSLSDWPKHVAGWNKSERLKVTVSSLNLKALVGSTHLPTDVRSTVQ